VRYFKIPDPVYSIPLEVYSYCTDADCDKLNKKFGGIVKDGHVGSWSQVTHRRTQHTRCIVVFRKGCDPTDVVHEFTHHTFHVMRAVGIPTSEDGEEAFVYYLQYLLSASWKQLRPLHAKDKK